MNIIISFLPGFIFYDYSNNSVTPDKKDVTFNFVRLSQKVHLYIPSYPQLIIYQDQGHIKSYPLILVGNVNKRTPKICFFTPTCGEPPCFQWKTIVFRGKLPFPSKLCFAQITVHLQINYIAFVLYIQGETYPHHPYIEISKLLSYDTIMQGYDLNMDAN